MKKLALDFGSLTGEPRQHLAKVVQQQLFALGYSWDGKQEYANLNTRAIVLGANFANNTLFMSDVKDNDILAFEEWTECCPPEEGLVCLDMVKGKDFSKFVDYAKALVRPTHKFIRGVSVTLLNDSVMFDVTELLVSLRPEVEAFRSGK